MLTTVVLLGVVAVAGTSTKVRASCVLESTVGFCGLVAGVPAIAEAVPVLSTMMLSISGFDGSAAGRVTVLRDAMEYGCPLIV